MFEIVTVHVAFFAVDKEVDGNVEKPEGNHGHLPSSHVGGQKDYAFSFLYESP